MRVILENFTFRTAVEPHFAEHSTGMLDFEIELWCQFKINGDSKNKYIREKRKRFFFQNLWNMKPFSNYTKAGTFACIFPLHRISSSETLSHHKNQRTFLKLPLKNYQICLQMLFDWREKMRGIKKSQIMKSSKIPTL